MLVESNCDLLILESVNNALPVLTCAEVQDYFSNLEKDGMCVDSLQESSSNETYVGTISVNSDPCIRQNVHSTYSDKVPSCSHSDEDIDTFF